MGFGGTLFADFGGTLMRSSWILEELYYSIGVNSALVLGEKPGRDFCEPNSDANQFRLGSSIQFFSSNFC